MDSIITWLASVLTNTLWWPWPADSSAVWLVWLVYGVVLAFVVAPLAVIVLTWMERKILARIQDRLGPNRAGPFGIFQAIADAIKMLTKEDITPQGADRVPYNLAPGLVAVAAVLVYAVLPVAPGIIGADLNIGVFYIVAVGSYSILGILIAGWSSNNKYALLGAFRAVAQLVAYEVPIAIALITITVVTGSMSTVAIVENQSPANGGWYIISLPLVFLIFFIANMAEVNRSPFDLLEAESELVAGFHVEYSGMKYAMFMIGEYVHVLAAAMMSSAFFFGGWQGPFVSSAMQASPVLGTILGLIYFLIKTGLMIFVIMWIRGTLPRFRIDQLLDFGWKFLTPVALVNLLVVALVIKLPLNALGSMGQTLLLLITNILIAFVSGLVVRAFARRSRNVKLQAVAGLPN